MKSDKLLSESFTNSELKDLARIVDFFEEQMCKDGMRTLTVKDCYSSFLKKDSASVADGQLQNFIDYKKQEEIYKNIDPTFFKDLWENAEATFFEGNDSLRVKYYNLKTNKSKYSIFLNKLSKTNTFIKKYKERAVINNDYYVPSTFGFFSYLYNRNDFSDIKIRIVYAFQFLHLNESSIRHQYELKKKINKNKNT